MEALNGHGIGEYLLKTNQITSIQTNSNKQKFPGLLTPTFSAIKDAR